MILLPSGYVAMIGYRKPVRHPIVLTTDDHILRTIQNKSNLGLRTYNPVNWLMDVDDEDNQ